MPVLPSSAECKHRCLCHLPQQKVSIGACAAFLSRRASRSSNRGMEETTRQSIIAAVIASLFFRLAHSLKPDIYIYIYEVLIMIPLSTEYVQVNISCGVQCVWVWQLCTRALYSIAPHICWVQSQREELEQQLYKWCNIACMYIGLRIKAY